MTHKTYYLDFGTARVYFNVENYQVYRHGKLTATTPGELKDFLQTANLLGFKAGKL